MKNSKRHTKKDLIFGQENQKIKEFPEGLKRVFISKQFKRKMLLSKDLSSFVCKIRSEISRKENINKYLHRHNNDFHEYNEKYLNATGIYHMHIGIGTETIINGEVSSSRSSDLVMAIPIKNKLYLLDILSHHNLEWRKKTVHLYRILLENNWYPMTASNIPCPRDNSSDSDEDQIADAIQNNLNVLLQINGKCYQLIGLISTDGSSGKALFKSDVIKDQLADIEKDQLIESRSDLDADEKLEKLIDTLKGENSDLFQTI